jgi:hypothetical protein
VVADPKNLVKMTTTTGIMQAGTRMTPGRVRHSSMRKNTTLTAQTAMEMMKSTKEPERERPMRLLRKLLSDVPARWNGAAGVEGHYRWGYEEADGMKKLSSDEERRNS